MGGMACVGDRQSLGCHTAIGARQAFCLGQAELEQHGHSHTGSERPLVNAGVVERWLWLRWRGRCCVTTGVMRHLSQAMKPTKCHHHTDALHGECRAAGIASNLNKMAGPFILVIDGKWLFRVVRLEYVFEAIFTFSV